MIFPDLIIYLDCGDIMPTRPSKEGLSKRQLMREQRAKKEQQQRLFVIIGIGAIALIALIVIVVASLNRSNNIVNSTPQAGISDVIVKITPKSHPKVDGTAMGDANAPVKVDVFEDFQCPACRHYSEDVELKVVEAYVANGKIRYTFHQYPFIDDQAPVKESDQAANASLCAAEQGRFWDYHDMLFINWQGENEGAFTDKRLVAFAETLGLDMSKFNTCYSAKTYQKQIVADLAMGDQLGMNGTPSVFVNNKIVSPGQVPTFEDMKQAIEAALAASK
jgi:protein-disulfide isomerase